MDVVVHDRRVVVGDVVVVGDGGDVSDARVGDVHLLEVVAAHVVRRHIGFSPSQREPSHASASTERQTHSEVGTAHPRDQRGSVDRTSNHHGTRRPCPISARAYPAAIMRRSETPRRFVNPGPAPRFDPHPMSIVIRSPPRRYGGDPYRSIFRLHAPGPVLIEIIGTDHVGGNVLIGLE
jgi:hypothetical protein